MVGSEITFANSLKSQIAKETNRKKANYDKKWPVCVLRVKLAPLLRGSNASIYRTVLASQSA